MATECLQEAGNETYELDTVVEDSWFKLDPGQKEVNAEEYDEVRRRAVPRAPRWENLAELRSGLRAHADELGIHKPWLVPIERDGAIAMTFLLPELSGFRAVHIICQADLWWVVEASDWPDYIWRCATESEACGIFGGIVEGEMENSAV